MIASDDHLTLTSAAKAHVRRVLPHSVYRLYRQRRVARQIATYKTRTVTHSYGGRPLTLELADPLAEGWYDHDWPRLNEIDELLRAGALRTDALVFDIGAHQAVVALMLAPEVGAGGRVIAVEAEPHNARIARRNVALNAVANVSVLHAAIAARPGTVHFAEGLNGHVDASTRTGNVAVEAVTVDELAERYGSPDVVFIDVEGYEGKALEGASRTLRSGRTVFFVEVHATELIDWDVASLLDAFERYELRWATEGAAGQAGPFRSLTHAPAADRFFLIASPAR